MNDTHTHLEYFNYLKYLLAINQCGWPGPLRAADAHTKIQSNNRRNELLCYVLYYVTMAIIQYAIK